SDRMRRGVHDIVLDTGRTAVRLPGGELDRGLVGAVMEPQRAGIEHDDEIRPAVLVPAGHGAGFEVPPRDAHDVVILLHGRDRRNGAGEGHRHYSGRFGPAPVITSCVCVTMAASLPSPRVILVCHTMVVRPRCSGVHSANAVSPI